MCFEANQELDPNQTPFHPVCLLKHRSCMRYRSQRLNSIVWLPLKLLRATLHAICRSGIRFYLCNTARSNFIEFREWQPLIEITARNILCNVASCSQPLNPVHTCEISRGTCIRNLNRRKYKGVSSVRRDGTSSHQRSFDFPFVL